MTTPMPKLITSKALDPQGNEVVLTYLTDDLTPLSEYERLGRDAGHSDGLIRDLLDGLAGSPLFEDRHLRGNLTIEVNE